MLDLMSRISQLTSSCPLQMLQVVVNLIKIKIGLRGSPNALLWCTSQSNFSRNNELQFMKFVMTLAMSWRPKFIFSFYPSAGTLAGLRESLQICIKWLMQTDSSVTSISSGCELFLRFITLAALDQEVGNVFLDITLASLNLTITVGEKSLNTSSIQGLYTYVRNWHGLLWVVKGLVCEGSWVRFRGERPVGFKWEREDCKNVVGLMCILAARDWHHLINMPFRVSPEGDSRPSHYAPQ